MEPARGTKRATPDADAATPPAKSARVTVLEVADLRALDQLEAVYAKDRYTFVSPSTPDTNVWFKMPECRVVFPPAIYRDDPPDSRHCSARIEPNADTTGLLNGAFTDRLLEIATRTAHFDGRRFGIPGYVSRISPKNIGKDYLPNISVSFFAPPDDVRVYDTRPGVEGPVRLKGSELKQGDIVTAVVEVQLYAPAGRAPQWSLRGVQLQLTHRPVRSVADDVDVIV